jgi:hypothetical protein
MIFQSIQIRLISKSDEVSKDRINRIEIVTNSKYNTFLRETNWRKGFGHGIHPEYTSGDGNTFASTNMIDKLNLNEVDKFDKSKLNEPAVNISWYDAIEYCSWAKCSLMTSFDFSIYKESINLSNKKYYWGAEWYDEAKAFMTVHMLANNLSQELILDTGGVNPDFRHKNIGFLVIYK